MTNMLHSGLDCCLTAEASLVPIQVLTDCLFCVLFSHLTMNTCLSLLWSGRIGLSRHYRTTLHEIIWSQINEQIKIKQHSSVQRNPDKQLTRVWLSSESMSQFQAVDSGAKIYCKSWSSLTKAISLPLFSIQVTDVNHPEWPFHFWFMIW